MARRQSPFGPPVRVPEAYWARIQNKERLRTADASVLALADHLQAAAILDEHARDVSDTREIETGDVASLVFSLIGD